MLTGGNQWLVEYQKKNHFCLQKKWTHIMIFQIHTSTTHVFFPVIFPVFVPSIFPSASLFSKQTNKKNPPKKTSNPPKCHPGRKKVRAETVIIHNRATMTEGSMLAAICVIFCMSCVWDGEVFFFCWEKMGRSCVCIFVCIYIYICKCYWKSQEDQRFLDDIENLLYT